MKIVIGTGVIIALTVLIVLAVIHASKPSGNATLTDQALVIDDIRGDHLGMTLKEYEAKHPYECSQDSCAGDETYAGLPTTKGASFTSDGKLWKITYGAKPWEADQILTAVEEKYGRPAGCINAEGNVCRWSNGKRSIRFSRFGTGMLLDFIDEALSAQWSAEYNARRAAERKTDQ